MPGKSFDALYYPYIHFLNVGWLKSTALYWDSISRTVPDGFEPKDPDEVKGLIDAGYIKDDHRRRRPDNDAVSQASDAIGRLLETYGGELRAARYGLQNQESWTATDPNVSALKLLDRVPGLDQRFGYIERQKYTNQMVEPLINMGLAKHVPESDWYGVHPMIEEAYLWALASETARTHGLRLLADNPRHHTAIMGDLEEALRDFLLGTYRTGTPPAGASANLDAVMMTVVLRNVRPRDYNDLPLSEIVRLRQRTAVARKMLQDELQDLVFDKAEYLREIPNADVLEERLDDLYKKRLKPSLDEMEKALHHRVDWKGTLAATFLAPPAVVAALAAPHVVVPGLLVCAGGALAVSVWQARKGRADVGNQDPVAFYLHQIADIEPAVVAEAVATSVRRWRRPSN